MSEHDENAANQGDEPKKPQDWESTMQPIAGSGAASEGDEFELDLEVDDIQTRLPYGSEDIADK